MIFHLCIVVRMFFCSCLCAYTSLLMLLGVYAFCLCFFVLVFFGVRESC